MQCSALLVVMAAGLTACITFCKCCMVAMGVTRQVMLHVHDAFLNDIHFSDTLAMSWGQHRQTFRLAAGGLRVTSNWLPAANTVTVHTTMSNCDTLHPQRVYLSLVLRACTSRDRNAQVQRHACYAPAAQGETISKVLLTVASICGDPSSYTEKGTVILLPKAAVAVARLQGAKPTL